MQNALSSLVNFSDVLVTVSLALLTFLLFKSRAPRLPLPPGPKASWWYGKVSLPHVAPWHTFAQWRETYGDIVYISQLGNPILYVNSAKAAADLLDKRSTNYSSRPYWPMWQDIIGWSWAFSGMPYGPTWRKYRALFQKQFSPNSSLYQPIQVQEAHTLLRNLADNPEKLDRHIERNAAALIMRISYGHHIEDDDDIFITLADKAMATAQQAAVFGTFLVDYIPLLKYVPAWMPGGKFKRHAAEWRKAVEAMVDQPFEMTKELMASGMAEPCFTTLELEESAGQAKDSEYVTMVKRVAAISYAAGSDTTVSTIASFFLTMMLYPEVQRKAQAHINKVVGPDRLPQFSDRKDLPYIDCIVFEILRWKPTVPLGFAHTSMEDDVYKGYLIPKGTTVLPNIWVIMHDEEVYPDPSAFYPERFEDQERNSALGINPLPEIAFGFGRRICPGRWLALDTLWITVASVLAVYNITKAVDKDGNVIEPDIEFTTALVSRPMPFKCSLALRSVEALELIKQTEDER